MELKSPTQKRKGNHIPKAPPFPLCNSTFYGDQNDYETLSGYFVGNAVIVDHPEEIKTLYTMGFFGKASLSKGFPNFHWRKENGAVVLKEHQWQRRKDWCTTFNNLMETIKSDEVQLQNENMDTSEVAIDSYCSVGQTSENCSDVGTSDGTVKRSSNNAVHNNIDITDVGSNSGDEVKTKEINLTITGARNLYESYSVEGTDVLVINDYKDDENLDNLNPHLEVEPFKTVIETLFLTLEEAFFLSFALGCLQITELSGKPLSLAQTWNIFNYSQPDFIQNYVAYHYFRAKGWVVKSGLKFGGQFLLYKEGPSYFHASYIVLIDNVRAKEDNIKNKEGELTWDRMNSMNRMAETCKKEIIICKIQWPELMDGDKENPLILRKFKVKEFLLRRWQPSQEIETCD